MANTDAQTKRIVKTNAQTNKMAKTDAQTNKIAKTDAQTDNKYNYKTLMLEQCIPMQILTKTTDININTNKMVPGSRDARWSLG